MAATQPTAIVCVGMAGRSTIKYRALKCACFDENLPTIFPFESSGSGKTTFMQRINSYLHSKREPPYVINLDPAVLNVPFDSNIDIRDSLNYKEVMREYNLGPNGGILTSLNIFATKIDQIINILEKRTAPPNPEKPTKAKPIKNIIVDTPGQIEVFVWSASGSILLDSLASSFPTVIAYIIDTPRTSSTSTFMSNMLYACSILYKTKLPMILVFNKTDIKDAEFAKEWMTDFEAFQAALRGEENSSSFGGSEGGGAGGGIGGGSGYMGSLLNSMSLMLEEFYAHLSVVGVSSMTGRGIPEFFAAVAEKTEEFKRDYQPELERRRQEIQEQKKANKERELGKLMKDMNVSGSSKNAKAQQDDDEDQDDENIEAEMVEPDEDDGEDGENGDGPQDDGLSNRYQKALADTGGGKDNAEDDHSFARYIRASQVG